MPNHTKSAKPYPAAASNSCMSSESKLLRNWAEHERTGRNEKAHQFGGRKIPPMNQIFGVAWLAVGLAWAYRSISRKDYSGLLIAAGFLVLAIFSFLRT
jgi:hypothetical protein